jgi:hypothetical protein
VPTRYFQARDGASIDKAVMTAKILPARAIGRLRMSAQYRACSAAAPRGAAFDDLLRASFGEFGALASGDKIESLGNRAATDMWNAHNTIAVSAMRF